MSGIMDRHQALLDTVFEGMQRAEAGAHIGFDDAGEFGQQFFIGVAIALVGLPFRMASLSARDQYEQDVANLCPSGCDASTLPGATRDLESRAETFNALEIAAYITGGSIAATGGILAYLNRERPIYAGDEQASMDFAPLVSDNFAGLMLGGTF